MNRHEFCEAQKQRNTLEDAMYEATRRQWFFSDGFLGTAVVDMFAGKPKLVVSVSGGSPPKEMWEKAKAIVAQWNRNELDHLPETL